jgi:hypothetical protein
MQSSMIQMAAHPSLPAGSPLRRQCLGRTPAGSGQAKPRNTDAGAKRRSAVASRHGRYAATRCDGPQQSKQLPAALHIQPTLVVPSGSWCTRRMTPDSTTKAPGPASPPERRTRSDPAQKASPVRYSAAAGARADTQQRHSGAGKEMGAAGSRADPGHAAHIALQPAPHGTCPLPKQSTWNPTHP